MTEHDPLQTKAYVPLNPLIARQRMHHQHIRGEKFETPHDVVSAMGFLQAQDYLGSLWAVGLRMKRSSEKSIELALAERSIVRTWPSRSTLGYTAAEDVRWVLDLLAPRAIAARQGRYRQLELIEEDFRVSSRLIEVALNMKHQLTRQESFQVLERGGVSTEGQRGIHILSHLAFQKLICFGPRSGKQQTFVLLDEWVPDLKSKPRSEGLSELTLRFFTSHGPATLKDFAWWSGLTLADVKTGLEDVRSRLIEETIDGKEYWMAAVEPEPGTMNEGAVLLPGFDEYLVGYTDRSAVLDPELARHVNANGGMLNPIIVIDGLVKGTWTRKLKKDAVEVEAKCLKDPDGKELAAFELAAEKYGEFLGLKVRRR